MASALFTLVQYYLKLEKISIDTSELKFQLESHPSYPSLHSITGVLNHFNIDNLAVEVEPINEKLPELPHNFIAVVNVNNRKDFAVVSFVNNRYQLRGTIFKGVYSPEQFLDIFTGIVLVAESTNNRISNNKFSGKYVWLTMLAIMIAVFYKHHSLINIVYLLFSIMGVFVSVSILKIEFGLQTQLGDAFCNDTSDNIDCDAVMNSKGATLFGQIKLSDFSLIYFIGILLSSIMLVLSKEKTNILLLLSLVSSIITIYSIFYQAIVVKKWCRLCLSIVGVLWFQAVLIFFENNSIQKIATSFTVKEFSIVLLSFILISAIWFYIKPKLHDYLDLAEEKIKLSKFKRHFNLFNNMLQKGDLFNTPMTETKELVFGNAESPLHIVVVTNPYCGHCRPVHKLIEEILIRYNETVKITVRFNINLSDKNSELVQISTRILEIYYTQGDKTALQAMSDIYGGMLVEKWFNKWNKARDVQKYFSTINASVEWCAKQNINFTPAILINGYSYPKEYDRSDLINFIEELYDYYESIE